MDLAGIELAKQGIEAAAKTAKEFIGKLIEPSLEEFGELFADKVRYWRLRNQIRIALKAQKLLSENGISPKRVSPKIILPLLEAGSLEEDELLSDKWASLLATAANPKAEVEVYPSFVQILKELSYQEAFIVDIVYGGVAPLLPTGSPVLSARLHIDMDVFQHFIKVSENELEVIIQNLCRLRILGESSLYGRNTKYPFIELMNGGSNYLVCLTELGFAFYKACNAEGKRVE